MKNGINSWHNNQPVVQLNTIKNYFSCLKGNNGAMPDGWQNTDLPKGLFNYLNEIAEAKDVSQDWERDPPSSKYCPSWNELKGFFQTNFNIALNCEAEGKFPGWPTSPGLVALISLVRIYNALNIALKKNESDESSEKLLKSLSVRSTPTNSHFGIVMWTYELHNNEACHSVLTRVWDKIKRFDRNESGGELSSEIRSAIFGDLSQYKPHLTEYRNHPVFDKLLGRSSVPIFQIACVKNKFSVHWITKAGE
jgi:hypothetical protein